MSKPERDYSETLFLPQTDFPMRAGLPQKEPELLKRWEQGDLYTQLRRAAKGREKFILHDGPPYANGNIHIGHALNKILKDVVTRSQQMLGYDCNYVPGWDCHGLPIEWKIEEENYRSKNKKKPDLSDPAAMIAFRQECRAYAEHWLKVQREEFKRLGVEGDWDHPYTTMDFFAEAQIARELMKFAANGLLYRGSKPVMWSVVEKTALAEAEVEYEDYTSDTVWVKFPVADVKLYFHEQVTPEIVRAKEQLKSDLLQSSVVIWTTTPWTIPGNRAISFSLDIEYSLYEVVEAPPNNWAKPGDRYLVANNLAEDVFRQSKVTNFKKLRDVVFDDGPADLVLTCSHPLKALGGYDFAVPLLVGDHVTDDAGTGFVHTAPGHGREDFDVWTANRNQLEERGINPNIPYTVDENGAFTEQAPGFTGKRVLNDKGEKGDANEAVIKALVNAGNIVARSRLKHQYPHSWRSKKPIIFRNTPQWFIAMDKPITATRVSVLIPATKDHPEFIDEDAGDTLRHRALHAIKVTRWVPEQGENRITGMIESRPDWVISRQRAWGVPIAVFIKAKPDGSVDILQDPEVEVRIVEAFEAEGADAWYAAGARERFLGKLANDGWQKVDDICDVWFDSGSTHAFVLEDPVHFPTLAGLKRKIDGGKDTVMYLEGSDQHRGWFHSSLLESCGTRGRAPFDVVLTHGFVLDENGRKMSKSLGNVTAPQDVIKQSGADILRMWVCASDYADDLRIGPEILKSTADTYRKLRNTIRWMLGTLAHFHDDERVKRDAMPELERLMLHRLSRARRAGAQGLRRFRLQAHLRRALGVHDLGPVGVLFRHPQGRALLRSDLVDEAQGQPHRDRPSVPLHRDVAGADAVLHRGRELAVALRRRRQVRIQVGASRNLPRGAGGLARRQAGREVAQGAHRARRRHRRAGDRARAKAHRLIAGGASDRARIERASSMKPWSTSISPRSASPRPPPGRRRRPDKRLPPGGCRRRRRGAQSRRRHQMRALVENPQHHRRRSAVPGRFAARRPGAARMGSHAQGGGVKNIAFEQFRLCAPRRRGHPRA